MIFDSLNRADTYRGISPQMDKALEVLTSTDFASLEPGRYDVNESVYFNVFTPTVKPYEETVYELHRKYIDIQYILNEGEAIEVCPIEKVGGWSPYDETDDYSITKEDADSTRLVMGPDRFAVLFPQDAHRGGIAVGEKVQVKKVVIKVLV